MAEKNSLWKNIRNKAKQNKRTGTKPKKPSAEMLKQERKIKASYANGGDMYPNGGTYANKQGVIMGPVENPDGSYTLPVSTEGLPQVNLPEFEIALESNPYGPVTGDEYLGSNFNPINWVLPSVEPDQPKFRPDGTLIPASGRADIDNTLPLAFMGAKPNYVNFERGVNKIGEKLTTQTPLKNAHKLNPWSFEKRINSKNPSKDFAYRTLGRQEGFENVLKSEAITPKPGGAYHLKHDAAFYNVGHPLLRYDDLAYKNGVLTKATGPRYIAEVPLSNPKVTPRYMDKPDNYRITKGIDKGGSGHVGINEPGVTIYKEDWLQGYKPVKSYRADGGHINPYMYYSGGPMEYGNGGRVLKHIGAGAYALGEGMLDTITMGATDQLTDKGFEGLTKLGNRNMDLNDPANAKFLKTQQQIKGYGNTAAAVTTGILTGNVSGAISQGAKGLDTAFQASDWASDDFKKWSGISSKAIGIGAGLAGSAINTEGASKGASEAAAKVGEIGGKVSPFVNQAVSMFGSNQQPMWQQAQAQQDLLNSPEYATQQSLNNQQYVNQGLSFASHGGNITNNSLNLQSMKGRYQNYKQRMSKGGKLEGHGISEIPSQVGLHKNHPRNGMQLGPDSSVEGEELIQYAEGGAPGLSSPTFVHPANVDGEENIKMPEMTSDYEMITDKYGMPKFSKKSPAQWLKEKLNRGSEFRTEVDSRSKHSGDQVKQIAEGGREVAMSVNELKNQQLIEEEFIAAYGGKINPKKYPGLNMPKRSKGGYVYNAMEQPMLAHGGPLVSNVQQPFNGPAAQNRGGMMMANGGEISYDIGGPYKLTDVDKLYPERNTEFPIESIDPINFLQDPQIQGITGNIQDIPMFNNQPSNFNAEDIEIPSINPIDFGSDLNYKDGKYSIKPKGMPSTITGDIQPIPPVSQMPDALQKYDPKEPWYNIAAGVAQVAPSLLATKKFMDLSKRRINPQLASPEKIDLERSRITAKEEGRRALDSVLRNVRGVGSNAGQIAGNARDMILNYIKNMGANIAKIYETEENTNAQLAQQTNMANQQHSNIFKQLNEEMYQSGIENAIAATQEAGKMTGENIKSANRLRNQRYQFRNMDTDDYIMVTDPKTGGPVKAFKSSDDTYKIMS
jgi:hypothetical protein